MARALIVEDEPISLADMESIVARSGFEVATASSGEEAVEIAERIRPDVVIMDIRLNGDSKDGIDYARILNKSGHTNLCFVTAHSDKATLMRAASVQPSAYLVKPFSENQLHAAVQIALNTRKPSLHSRLSANQFQAAMDSLPVPTCIISARGDVQFANEAFAQIFPYVEGGKFRIEDCMPPEIAENHNSYIQRYLTTRNPVVIGKGREIEAIDKTGRKFKAMLSVGHIQIDGDDYFIGAIEDLSSIHAAQNRMRQLDRMECFFTFSTGIAHHFNNLLTVIIGSLSTISGGFVTLTDEQRSKLMAKALDAAERMSSINKTLVGLFAFDSTLTRSLRSFAVQVDEFSRPTCPENVELKVTCDNHALSSRINQPAVLFQILSHCIRNSLDALKPNGGRIGVHFTQIEVSEKSPITVFGGMLKNGAYSEVTVSDSGPGMTEEQISRCFDPFYSTHTDKNLVAGKGLGLFQCISLSTQAGGGLNIWSQLGKGTRVTIFYPIAAQTEATGAVEKI